MLTLPTLTSSTFNYLLEIECYKKPKLFISWKHLKTPGSLALFRPQKDLRAYFFSAALEIPP